MRRRWAPSCGLVLALFFLSGGTQPAPEAAAAAERRQLVVIHAATLDLTVGAIEDRLAAMPHVQLLAYGATPDAIRHTFLSDVLIPQTLLSLRARIDGLEREPSTAYLLEQARSAATLHAIRKRIDEGPPATPDEVRSYYERNGFRYRAPANLRIWRILCKSREEAQTVLNALTPDTTPKAFSDLAREHSLDKGTYLRGGDLGFVSEDGTTNEPGLRVDANVVRAAASVKDGDWVRSPVSEGEYFAIVWRRGTRAAHSSSLSEATPQIRDTLRKERLKQEVDALLESLRAARVGDRNDALLDSLEPVAAEPGANRKDQ
jgi:hypothetical protein